MTRRAVQLMPVEPQKCSLVIFLTEAERLIDERIQDGQTLKEESIENSEDLYQAKQKMYRWATYNKELLRRIADTSGLENSYRRQAFVYLGRNYFCRRTRRLLS